MKRLSAASSSDALPAGNLAAPPRVSAHPPSYQAAVGNLNDPDDTGDDMGEEGSTSKDGKKVRPGDKKKKKKEKEPKREREPLGSEEKENNKRKGKQSVSESESQLEDGGEEDDDRPEVRRAKLFKRKIVRKLSMKRWL